MARRRTDRDHGRAPDPVDLYLRPIRPIVSHRPLQLLEDRRLWHPERAFRPALSFGRKSRLVVAPTKSRIMSHRIAFDVPKRVAICVRRKSRKEVLFAKNKAGRGGARRSPRRNYWSSVNC